MADSAVSAIASKFLNGTGLQHLIDKIKVALDSKADKSQVVYKNSAGQIDSEYLPSYVDDVVEFEGTVVALSPVELKEGTSIVDNGKIVFISNGKYINNENVKTFAYAVTTQQSSGGKIEYYAGWNGMSSYIESYGGQPYKGKIYVDTTTNKSYRWSGSDLVEIGNGEVTGATADALGGIKVGYTSTGKNYAVQLDDNQKAYVTVPWTEDSAVTADSIKNLKNN